MLAQKLPERWNGQLLAMELFKRMAGADMIHVPFKGAGAANAAVVAGRVQILNTALGAAMTFIKSGKLKGLAVTGLKRAASAPEGLRELIATELQLWRKVLKDANISANVQ